MRPGQTGRPGRAVELLAELTGGSDHMLPLIVACLAPYGMAEAMSDVPIYEALRVCAKRHNEAATDHRGGGATARARPLSNPARCYPASRLEQLLP